MAEQLARKQIRGKGDPKTPLLQMCDANLLRRSDVAGGETLKLPMISTITALCSKAQPPPLPPFCMHSFNSLPMEPIKGVLCGHLNF
jgi:hypothetical protein